MNHTMKRILLMFMCLGLVSQVEAQVSVTAGINPTNLPCGGGNVDLTALGNSTTPVFGDNFNTGSVSPGWQASPAAQFNNPCGAPVDGTTYLWMGSATSAPRTMQTAEVDLSCGGTVCFDFKFTCEACGDSAPCEGADYYNEGVSLQWSTDGVTWTDFAYFAPNGDLLTAYPGAVTFPGATGNTPFTTWQNYCFTVPAGAWSATTSFRLYQWGSSGSGFDHWGIDNFYVYADPCAPFYYDWDFLPGSPDAPNVSTNVTETTTFEVCYTNGTQSACETVTVTVASIDITNLTIGTEACLGDNTGSVNVTVAGGTPGYTYNLSGPTASSNGTGVFNNLAPGFYTVTINDATTCVIDSSFTIDPGPACCTVSATSTDALCNGTATGTATANPANGVAPYTYEWFDAGMTPIGQTSQTANNLAAGTYNVEITDFNGCTSTVSVVVGEPAVLTATATPTNVSCFSLCDGAVTVNAPAGGTPGYTYSLNGGAFGASPNFNGLCAGTYTAIAQDNNGCQVTMTNISVTQPADLTLVEASNTPATCGSANGELSVTAGGGTPGYQYDIGGAQQGSPVFSGLAAGNYTVTVTDNNGCTETVNIVINSLAGPAPFVDVLNDVTCAGGVNGSVTIGVGGGSAPYQFSLDAGPNQASNTFAVSAGNHTVVVTDNNGCTGSVDFVVGQPSSLTYNVVITDALCNGSCDGTITVNANGATPGYEYSSDGGIVFQASNVLTGLCPGNVNVVVRDSQGCLANSTETIGQPPVLTTSSSFVEPSCHGVADGEISFTPGGGTPGYVYSIDNGATFNLGANPITDVPAGTYDLVVEDANGCQVTDNITVTEPPAFSFSYIANDPSNCGANDGSFEISADNGLAPYTYSIDGGNNTQGNGLFQNLYSGLYTLLVEDANGCKDSVYEALSDNIMTTQTDLIVDVSCYNGSDGFVQVSQNNGSAPFTYTINTNPGTPQGFNFFGNLSAGTYYITVEDDGLCIAIEEVTVNQPDTITFTPTTVDITCPDGADGEIDFGPVTGGDGGPYTYSIDGTNYFANPVFTGLTSGTYTIFAQDGNGCLGSTTVTLDEPTPWGATINATDLTCFQNGTGFVQIIPSGATSPYSYDLGGNVNVTGIYPGLSAQVYAIQITDDLGCTFDTSVTINEPPLLVANVTITDVLCNGGSTGEAEITANGGTPPYLYSSDGGTLNQSGNIITGLATGNYDFYVIDDNDCSVLIPDNVPEPAPLTMTLASTNATCGLDNAELTITGGGGVGGYQYSIDAGATFPGPSTFTGLQPTPTNYTVVVEDANGCQIDSVTTIGEDAVPVIDNIISVNPLCFGSADGSIEIIASGGVGALQYDIGTGFGPGNVFNGLMDGNYVVQVMDANGCIATTNVTLTEPLLLTIGGIATDLLCNGDFTGSIQLSANGGSPQYTYSIDNGGSFQGGGTFTFLAAGTYDIVTMDANGCTAADIIVCDEPDVLAWNTFNITDPSCYLECDGAVATIAEGGTAPYTYNWSGNIATPADTDANGICDGTYSVIVTDDNGCQIDSLNFEINQPAPVIINSVVSTETDCFNDPAGSSIVIDAPTAVNYQIDGPVSDNNGTGTFVDLPIGNYDITVFDIDGCTAVSNTTIDQPDSLYAIAPQDWFGCFGSTVNVQAFVNGGTVPYTYLWTDSDGGTETDLLFTYDINTVAPGVNFELVATDANGCQSEPVSFNISAQDPLVLDGMSADTMICLGGTATISGYASGGELIDFGPYMGYSYVWDTGVIDDTVQTIDVSPAVATTYNVTITDGCGAQVQGSVTVGIHDDPIADILGGGNGCIPESMTFENPSLEPGATVLWEFGDGSTSHDPGPVSHLYTQLGCYDVTLTVTSQYGCVTTQTYADLVCINDNPKAGFYWTPQSPTVLDPTIEITDASHNASVYTYDFGTYGTSSLAEPTFTFPGITEETDIEVCQYVMSDMGCVDTMCAIVPIHEEVIFYVPNVFTPDGDAYNQTFRPVFASGVDPYDYHLTIFNRWGEIVFESYNYDYGWNGHYGDGGLVEDGVYVWQIEFGEKATDDRQMHRGHVTILK